MGKYIQTNDGLALWTESFGTPTDRPLLLIMGAMNQGVFWPDEFCMALAAAGFYVIRYDHRDTGKSAKVDYSTTPYDLNGLAADAVAVIHAYKIEKAVIIGLSMGGYIAQLIAIDSPRLAERLVLISTSADHRPYMAATMGRSTAEFDLPGPDNKLLDYIRSTLANPPGSPDEVTENLVKGWEITYGGNRPFPREQLVQTLRLAAERSPDQSAGYHHALAVAASPERLQSVKRIQTPTLIIHGKFDLLLPVAHANYLARQIPDAKLRLFDMGHSFMWSWQDEVLSAILSFIVDGRHGDFSQR